MWPSQKTTVILMMCYRFGACLQSSGRKKATITTVFGPVVKWSFKVGFLKIEKQLRVKSIMSVGYLLLLLLLAQFSSLLLQFLYDLIFYLLTFLEHFYRKLWNPPQFVTEEIFWRPTIHIMSMSIQVMSICWCNVTASSLSFLS